MHSQPSKIICVGRNYVDHAKELGNAIPDRAVLFIKPPSSLVSLEDGISWNPAWGNCHHECELSLRIDRQLKAENDPQKALQAIGAVTLGLDLTLRELQDDLKKKGQPWERSKAFDGSCVLGDWVDVSEVKDWSSDKTNEYISAFARGKKHIEEDVFAVSSPIYEFAGKSIEKDSKDPKTVDVKFSGEITVFLKMGDDNQCIFINSF